MTKPIAQGPLSPESFQNHLLEQLGRGLQTASGNASRSQARFLDLRQASLEQLAGMIARQIPGGSAPVAPNTHALYTSEQLDEFGRGSLAKCLGPDYLPFETRRSPRIPNGDLKLMSRIVAIDAQQGRLSTPASIVAEVDIPADAWYLEENAYPTLPYSVLMEIALQPCGFLSAFLGSSLKFAPVDLYFRNLDGQAQVLREVGGGQVLTTHAQLRSSVFSGDTMIQRYAFEISAGGQPVFTGESAFGYFTRETMARQVGLDGGRESAPLQEQTAQAGKWVRLGQIDLDRPHFKTATGRLGFLDQVFVSPGGGKCGQGYVYATRANNPLDWYYDCHFYQDPVMPGSLGVEAVLQALQAFALEQGLGAGMHSPRFGLPQAGTMVWKYRGQIVPENRVMKLEAHIQNVERTPQGVTVTADASVWADGVRIYEIHQATVGVVEG